jgi:hypothetical protein
MFLPVQVVCSEINAFVGLRNVAIPLDYNVCLVWARCNEATFGDLETTLGAVSFPRVRFIYLFF